MTARKPVEQKASGKADYENYNKRYDGEYIPSPFTSPNEHGVVCCAMIVMQP
jgi:hypothetical protein